MEKISSNRSFGILFCIVFALISVWPIIDGGSLRVWSISISVIFLRIILIWASKKEARLQRHTTGSFEISSYTRT